MKKIIPVILCLFAWSWSMATPPHKHKKHQSASTHIVSVSMQRTGCYGRCPDYTINIDRSGIVTYTGNRFVTDTGTFQKSIGAKKAMDIIDQFNTYQVDTCQDVYYNRVSDLPGIVLTIAYKTHTKKILNAHYGPAFLGTLARTIDDAGKKTDSTGWKKVLPSVIK